MEQDTVFTNCGLLLKVHGDCKAKQNQSIFARDGIPEVVVSDNGPQFSAEVYAEFALAYQFMHITSNPYYSQSNREAERPVGIIEEGE